MDFTAMIGQLGFYLWDANGDQQTTIIRIGAGILAVVVLVVLIQRRRTRAK